MLFAVLGIAFTVHGALTPNAQGSPQELKDGAGPAVCAGRSAHCSVLLDVPAACGGSSTCPVAFFFHWHGGNNKGFAHNAVGKLCHEYGFIGVYP